MLGSPMFDRNARLRLALTLCAVLAACGTPEDENAQTNNTTAPTNVIPNNAQNGPRWTSSVVDANNVGLHVRLVHSGSMFGLVYFDARGTDDGVCETAGDNQPQRIVWGLHYGTSVDGTSWATEKISDLLHVGPPVGTDLVFDASGSPMVTAMTGEPLLAMIPFYCGVNDVGLWTRNGGGWTDESVVVSSGEAATGHPPSDFGEVVGYWPSIALDNSGNPAIVYKDVHAGSIQSDDLRRADLELAWRQGDGWQNIAIDFGEGGGDHNRIRFDGQNRPHVAYYRATEDRLEPSLGIWMTRSLDAGATWEKVRLFPSGTSEGPDFVFDPATGLPLVAYYNSERGFPQLAELTDEAQFESASQGWKISDIGDSAFDEGYRTSLAISPGGTVAVAYYRCTRASQGLGDCKPADDGLVFAYRDRDTWIHEVVDPGDAAGLCGQYPSLAFDAAGIAHIAYQCEATDSGSINNTVKVARRATAL